MPRFKIVATTWTSRASDVCNFFFCQFLESRGRRGWNTGLWRPNVFHHPLRGGRDAMRRRGIDIPRCQLCITTPPGTQARKGERHEENCPLFCSSLLLPKLSSTRTRPRLCVKDRCCLVQEIPSTGTALFMSAATGGIVFSVSRILMVQLPAFKDGGGGGKIKTWTDLWRSAGFFAQSHRTSALKRAGR